jgi:hypothetical protein
MWHIFCIYDREHSRSLHSEIHPAQAMPHHETTDLFCSRSWAKATTIFRQKIDRDNFVRAPSKPTVKCEILGEICSSGKQYAPNSTPFVAQPAAINRSTVRLDKHIQPRQIREKNKASTSIYPCSLIPLIGSNTRREKHTPKQPPKPTPAATTRLTEPATTSRSLADIVSKNGGKGLERRPETGRGSPEARRRRWGRWRRKEAKSFGREASGGWGGGGGRDIGAPRACGSGEGGGGGRWRWEWDVKQGAGRCRTGKLGEDCSGEEEGDAPLSTRPCQRGIIPGPP